MKVIYAGVEAEFVDSIPERDAETDEGPLRLLFAGEIGQRKGADVLFRALSTLKGVDWTLDLVGAITPAIAAGWSKFLGDPRVTWHGTVRIRQLAALMSRAEVFVFPSLAEGSARVVAMAMAAGCYVVTTPNSGSVVQDGVHGRLVPPGDHDALAATLMEIADRRGTLLPIGRANADLIRREYLVEHYVDRVISFYGEVLGLAGEPSAVGRLEVAFEVIGSGLLARAFASAAETGPDAIICASGVSDSQCTDESAFRRERALLRDLTGRARARDAVLVYFSGAPVYGRVSGLRVEDEGATPETPYGCHKLACEDLVGRAGLGTWCFASRMSWGRAAILGSSFRRWLARPSTDPSWSGSGQLVISLTWTTSWQSWPRSLAAVWTTRS